jgi:hypothetical protein
MTARHVAALLALSALAGLAWTTGAEAQNAAGRPAGCQLVIEPGSSRWTIESYDPYSGAPAYGQFQMTWINQGDQQCIGDAAVSLKGEAYGLRSQTAPSTDRLRYGLVNESSGADLTPYTGAWSGTFNGPPLRVEPGERVVQTFGLLVDTEDLGGDGLFQQTVTFGLRRRNSVVYEAERDVTLAINVRPSAVMGLTGTFQRNNGVASINLGELTPGRTNDPVNLWVRGTRGYRVMVQSRNQGRLVQSGGDWSVPYGLSLGGVPIDLANPVPFQSTPGPGLRNDSYPLVITVGQTAGQRAGRYSDLLTLTLAPM